MFERTVSPDDLARLTREREQADHGYNAALTELDQAILQPPEPPQPLPPFDESQASLFTERWQIVPQEGPDLGTGWRRRLRGLVWRFIGPLLQRQQQFNASLVDHINRNVASVRELDALATFQSRLIPYLQQITPFVDTKDREVAGLMRRIVEDVAEVADVLDRRSRGLAGGIDGVTDELRKRWESTVVREQRFVQQVDELRTTVGQVQHGLLAIRHELERRMTVSEEATRGPAATPSTQTSGLADAMEAYTYVGFENLFRGGREEIRARLADYVPYFEGASVVLDVGCGRGEFLELLRERGIRARGLDINMGMIDVCRSRGLEADVGDALGHLDALSDEALGGLFAAQVVEHLPPAYLIRLLHVASRKLRPGSKIVLETINPACWFAFFDGYIRDLTHVRPLHPDTLKYLLSATGFQRTAIRYSAPYPEHGKLQPISVPAGDGGPGDNRWTLELVNLFNENAEKLNRLLFTHLDYAVIGERL